MSFGDCSFAGGHVGITQEMCLKYTRNITKQPPGMSQRGRRPTTRQIRAQPVEKEDETQTKLSPSGINFHRTNQEAYWRTPIETRLIQAQSWCGRTTGAAAPPLDRLAQTFADCHLPPFQGQLPRFGLGSMHPEVGLLTYEGEGIF